MYQLKVALCMFSGEVSWPVCTKEDKRIDQSDIVSNQPSMSVDKHTENAQCHFQLIHPHTGKSSSNHVFRQQVGSERRRNFLRVPKFFRRRHTTQEQRTLHPPDEYSCERAAGTAGETACRTPRTGEVSPWSAFEPCVGSGCTPC